MAEFRTAQGRWRPLIAIAVAYAIALQMLLASLAAIDLSAAGTSSAADPFVTCFGGTGTPADNQTPIQQPLHLQHCVLCSVAAASAALLPMTAKPIVHPTVGVSIHWSATAAIVSTRHFTPRLSQGPPQNA